MRKFQPKPAPSRRVASEKSVLSMGYQAREFQQDEATAKFAPCLTCVERMIKNRECTDTKVLVGVETFDCHMIILKSYSEFFAKLDKDEDVDKQSIILPEDKITPMAFYIIYEWMLDDNAYPQRQFFAEVFKAATFLNIRELLGQQMACIDDMKQIGEREALSIYLEAKGADEKHLQKLMVKKISKIFLTFASSWEFLVLQSDEVEIMFRSNRLAVNSELDMLFVAIRWLQHEWPMRKKSIASLMKFVRFNLFESWQLVELKKYPKELENIFKITEVQELIDKALSIISLRNLYTDGEPPQESINRCLIDDPLWRQFKFDKNPNMFINYCNFSKYLKQLVGDRWRSLKYADPKHESM